VPARHGSGAPPLQKCFDSFAVAARRRPVSFARRTCAGRSRPSRVCQSSRRLDDRIGGRPARLDRRRSGVPIATPHRWGVAPTAWIHHRQRARVAALRSRCLGAGDDGGVDGPITARGMGNRRECLQDRWLRSLRRRATNGASPQAKCFWWCGLRFHRRPEGRRPVWFLLPQRV